MAGSTVIGASPGQIRTAKEALNKSFDRLTTNGNLLIPFVVSPEPVEGSNHEWNPFVQRSPNAEKAVWILAEPAVTPLPDRFKRTSPAGRTPAKPTPPIR